MLRVNGQSDDKCICDICLVEEYIDPLCSSFQHCSRHLVSLDDIAEIRTPPGPCVVGDDVGWVGFEWSVVCVELAGLVRRTSPLPVSTHESRVCWVSCVLSWHVLSEGQVHYQCVSVDTRVYRVCWVSWMLSWHVLSEGQVHYQCGHTSLECVVSVELAHLVRRTSPLPVWTHESRVCWVSWVLSWHVLSEAR